MDLEKKLRVWLQRRMCPAPPAVIDYDLLSIYASGCATAEETQRVEAQMRANPEIAALVRAARDVLRDAADEPPRRATPVWSSRVVTLVARLLQQGGTLLRPRYGYAFAGVAALVLVVVAWQWMVHGPEDGAYQPQRLRSVTPVSPTSTNAPDLAVTVTNGHARAHDSSQRD